MLNRSGNTTDNLCFRYWFRDVFSRFRCCVYNGTGPLLRKHNGNMELHVSATFQKYGNMWFRPVCVVACVRCRWKSLLFEYKRILLIGRAIWTRHIRNGKELPEIARDDHYDFNFQVGVLLVHLNLTNKMCSVKKYYPVFLFTSQPEIIKAGARNISCWDVRQTHPKIVSCWYLLAWLFCHHRI